MRLRPVYFTIFFLQKNRISMFPNLFRYISPQEKYNCLIPMCISYFFYIKIQLLKIQLCIPPSDLIVCWFTKKTQFYFPKYFPYIFYIILVHTKKRNRFHTSSFYIMLAPKNTIVFFLGLFRFFCAWKKHKGISPRVAHSILFKKNAIVFSPNILRHILSLR